VGLESNHLRLPAFALLAAAILAACGGATGQPTGTATGAGSPSPNAGPALQFARCMRAHGVSSFPDPKPGSGGIQIPDNLNPQSPSFRSAQQACKQFLPIKSGPLATAAADRQAALKLAKCMRAHGVPQFPDPLLSPSPHAQRVLVLRGMVFAIPMSVVPQSPAFQQAAHACGFGRP
jgi:hypothetical protein